MKRLCIVLVLLALLLTACGKAKPAATTAPPTEKATTTQPPSTEAPEAPTTTEEPEISTEPPLTWGREPEIKMYTEGDISIPYLSMPGEDVKEINEEIEKNFPRTKGYYYVHTDWFVHNDILTVQIAYYEKDMGEAIKEQYCVYSLRLSDRKRMTDEEVLQEAGMSREAFEEKAAVVLLDKFIRNLENSSIYKEDSDRYNEAAWKHICEEKVKTAQPYFGEDGTLWVYGWTHQIAGQGSQPEILPLDMELCEACETWLAKQ